MAQARNNREQVAANPTRHRPLYELPVAAVWGPVAQPWPPGNGDERQGVLERDDSTCSRSRIGLQVSGFIKLGKLKMSR
jgi:hypothetical protein